MVGFTVAEQTHDYYMAGVLLCDVSSPPDTMYFVFNPQFGMCIGLIPIGKNRQRAYYMYPKTMEYRLQGTQMLDLFFRESARCYAPLADYYAATKCTGPLASFDVSELWVEHVYRDGVVLMGGCGVHLRPHLRPGPFFRPGGARVLRDELTANHDWTTSANHYAEKHRRWRGACCTVEGWFRTLFQDSNSQSAALREKAMPLIAEDPTRVPDHIFSGPELPVNDAERPPPGGYVQTRLPYIQAIKQPALHCLTKCVLGFSANANSSETRIAS
jgi:menaquinone-9 beta-reductase